MKNPKIEEFAKILVRRVRDEAIREADLALDPSSPGPVASRWRAAGVKAADVVIPDVVDQTIYQLLDAIDNGVLRLVFVSYDGMTIDLTKAGGEELAGWFAGDAWKQAYAEERFADDFADLQPPWKEGE